MHPYLNTAIKAARRAGSVINRSALDGAPLEVHAKQANDFVTQVDKAAERAAIDIIRRAYPEHAILAEESGEDLGGEPRKGGAKRTQPAAPTRAGSSIRSTEPPTSSMAFRSIACRSRSNTAAGSSTQ